MNVFEKLRALLENHHLEIDWLSEKIERLLKDAYRQGYKEGQRHPVVRIDEDGRPVELAHCPPQTDYTGLMP